MEKPPIIKQPVRSTGTKSLLLFLVATFGVIVSVAYLIRPQPPKEAQLIQDFRAHRAAYDHLRDMLQADGQVDRLADWGVATINSGPRIPPDGDFPVERYREYMRLLKEVGGRVAYRDEGAQANPGVVVWVWGWAGKTRHIGVCWLEQAPTNQIATLDGYRSRRYPERVVAYRHIDEKWHLWTDL